MDVTDIQCLSEHLFNQDDLVELVYDYDYSVIPYQTTTKLYSLPETDTKSVTHTLNLEGQAWPNPASQQVNIPVPGAYG